MHLLKNRFSLLAASLLFVASAVASPAAPDAAVSRAARLTGYFTGVLHLTKKQAGAVRAVTLTKLQRLEALQRTPDSPLASAAAAGEAPILRAYDAAMLTILQPGQYSAFRLLLDREPTQETRMQAHLEEK